ncbi:MAG: hypothetical protein IKW33_04440 [Clostridia bacterium]|nr:hypothetical protein [Clostridia bacterium]
MKRKNEINRVKELIDNDRFNTKDDFKELVEKDLYKLLLEYFEIIDFPTLVIEKNNNFLQVNINFKCNRIRTFGTLPYEDLT